MRYNPRSSVTPRNLLPDAPCVATTVTPGRTALVESVTVPLRTASCACATPGGTSKEPTRTTHPISLDLIRTSTRQERRLGHRERTTMRAAARRRAPRRGGHERSEGGESPIYAYDIRLTVFAPEMRSTCSCRRCDRRWLP